jgi:hypothetical protein
MAALKAFGMTSTAAMGWIGAALAVASLAIGVIQGIAQSNAEQEAKKAESYTNALKKQMEAEKEVSEAHKSAMESFVNSYNIYATTGEVTEDLIVSA